MAVWQRRITVGTTAVRLDDVETTPNIMLIVKNRSANSVFVGGSDVTIANGFELGSGDGLGVRMPQNAGGLYAVAVQAGNRLDRLQVSL